MLSADFSLAAGGLVLDGFQGARDLSIIEAEGEYRFTLDQGQWNPADGSETPEGFRVEGNTLAVDKLAVDPLVDGVTVIAPADGFQLDVSIEGGDFAGLAGGLTLDGVSSINAPAGPPVAALPVAAFSIAALPSGPPTVVALQAGPPTLTIGGFNSATDVNIIANGSIGTAPGTQITVGGDLTIISRPLAGVGGIELASNAGDLLSVAGNATFEAQSADGTARFDIHVGVDALGNQGGTAEFGSLSVFGGKATVFEADETVLGSSDVASLDLTSSGSITDAGGSIVSVAGNASFSANDPTSNQIALDATHNFGTLTFDGGAVAIAEQSGTVLTGDSRADSLDLDSAGAITDTDGAASLDVDGLAEFTSTTGDAITLDDNLTLGSLRFAGGGVAISEAAGGSTDGTELSGVSTADSLDLVSAGPITDTDATVVTVLGNARFDSTTDDAIILDATHNFGSLTFDGGAVAITEQSGTVLAGTNVANELGLTSGGVITDLSDTTLRVGLPTGDATLLAAGSIILGDAGAGNEIDINGLGSFTAGSGQQIAIGVVPSIGGPADATATIDRLRFEVAGGNTRVALDGDVTLDGKSLAGDVELNAFGPGFNITDLPNSDVRFERTAILRAAGDNIVLGDATGAGASRFGHEVSPGVFDADEFLALEARNVSIVADTGINLRTGPDETPFAGTFFLRAAGTIAQVGVAGQFTPLTAQRIALASGGIETPGIETPGNGIPGDGAPNGGAVLFSRIVLTSDDGPNLAIEAGGAESFVGVLEGRTEFPTAEIAGGADGEFLPVNIADRTGATAFLDSLGNDQGLELLPNGQVTEPTDAFGDLFSIVAVVDGDATIGIVRDATNPLSLDQVQARPDQVGVEVTDGVGNAFLRSLAAGDDDNGAPEPGNLRFTSADAPTETVVSIQAGVFTAIADGLLTIDTDAPDEAVGDLTTRLVSSTGTVTSVAAFETVLGVPLELPSGLPIDPDTDLILLNPVGPRFILDPPSNLIGAATTDQVVTGESGNTVPLGQTVTFAIGSRGEDGLIVELETADVLLRRDSPLDLLPVSLAAGGGFPGSVILGPGGELLFDPLNDGRSNPLVDTDGTIPLPVVALAPADLDTLPASELVTQASDPNLDFRVVTVTHVFSEAFIQSNELVTILPTTIRVYNDPGINLFDQGGERSLNENVNFLEPDINSLVGFFLPIPRDEPTVFPIIEPTIIVPPPAVAPAPSADADLQSSASSDTETILFGRRDGEDTDADGFADDVPGESWPQVWEGDEGDFIEQIRQLVDEGPYSEGEYLIITKSPRGEQQLEVWVKGDAAEEQSIDAGDNTTPPTDAGADATLPGEARVETTPSDLKASAVITPAVDSIATDAEQRVAPQASAWETLAAPVADRDDEAMLQSLGLGVGVVVGLTVSRQNADPTAAPVSRSARRRRRVQQLLAQARRAGRRAGATGKEATR